MIKELSPRVFELARLAKANNIALTIDAEEADRLSLALDIFSLVLKEPELSGWDGFGIVVQAYQKMAAAVISFIGIACCRNRAQNPGTIGERGLLGHRK